MTTPPEPILAIELPAQWQDLAPILRHFSIQEDRSTLIFLSPGDQCSFIYRDQSETSYPIKDSSILLLQHNITRENRLDSVHILAKASRPIVPASVERIIDVRHNRSVFPR